MVLLLLPLLVLLATPLLTPFLLCAPSCRLVWCSRACLPPVRSSVRSAVFVSFMPSGSRSPGRQACNVTDSNIFETKVPGAFELPLAAR